MRRAAYALLAYFVITLLMTWPLARGLTRDVAWDLGDSVLNMWILAWDCEQIRAILTGHFARAGDFFNANIFHPAPLALAYSEHLVPQALQILPVYLLTGNPILAYNLLFLSTFALSGLGMFLLLRDLTGNTLAAFIGGLLYAFAPYRIPQSSHLQVLSSQWMPLVFFGVRRYFATGNRRALAGAGAAAIAQNLSCGYYLLYFPPFVAGYIVWELWRGRRWRDRRVFLDLALAGAAVIAVTLPFVIPYVLVRESLQLARSVTEATRLSADVYSYATASELQRFWGPRLSTVFPKPEGELFPGLITVLLAVVGIFWGAPSSERRVPADAADIPPRKRWLVRAGMALAAIHLAAAVFAIIVRRATLDLVLFDVSLGNVTQLLLRAAVAYGLVLILSPVSRQHAAAFLTSRGWFALALVTAVWLSLGPAPRVLGRPLDLASPYRLLWDVVPGFDGLRVPARFGMIVALMLAILGGYGIAAIARRSRGWLIAATVAALFLFEAGASPFVVNAMEPVRGFRTPDARLFRPARAPAVYQAVKQTPVDAIVAELPIGQTDYDVRAMYYSTVHWRKLVNGYSGFFPPHYGRVTFALSQIPRHPEVSLGVLREVGTTHVLIHEAAYLDDEGTATTAVLIGLGAQEIFRDAGDVLLALPLAGR